MTAKAECGKEPCVAALIHTCPLATRNPVTGKSFDATGRRPAGGGRSRSSPASAAPPPAARSCSCLVADGQHHPAAPLPAGPACGRPSSCGQTQTSAAEHRRGPVWPPTVSIARSPRPPAGPACGRPSRRAAEPRRYPQNRAYIF